VNTYLALTGKRYYAEVGSSEILFRSDSGSIALILVKSNRNCNPRLIWILY